MESTLQEITRTIAHINTTLPLLASFQQKERVKMVQGLDLVLQESCEPVRGLGDLIGDCKRVGL